MAVAPPNASTMAMKYGSRFHAQRSLSEQVVYTMAVLKYRQLPRKMEK
jgi:hypothetical protein